MEEYIGELNLGNCHVCGERFFTSGAGGSQCVHCGAIVGAGAEIGFAGAPEHTTRDMTGRLDDSRRYSVMDHLW